MTSHDAVTTTRSESTGASAIGALRLADRDSLLRLAAFVAVGAAIYQLLSRYWLASFASWPLQFASTGVALLTALLLFQCSRRRHTQLVALKDVVDRELSREMASRGRAEHLLEERTHLLDTLIQTCPVGIIVHGRSREVKLANPAFCDIFGYTQEECIGRKLEELIVPPGAEKAFLENIERIAKGAVLHGALKRKRKDGSLVDVELHAKRLLEEFEYCGAFALFRDITEQKRSEEADAFFAAIVDSSHDSIVGTDLDGRI